MRTQTEQGGKGVRGTNGDRKRLIRVTAGNIDNESITVTGHHDFFPPDCIGSSKRAANGQTKPIQILLDGLNATIETDIPCDSKTGRARGIFRGRRWVGEFFHHHRIKAGDVLALEKLAKRRYRLLIANELFCESVKPPAALRRNGPRKTLTVGEFFAGIGLVRLALESEGWRVLFANDICPDKAEMYRHNWPNDNSFVVGDIHRIDVDEIPACDLFTASFPCNDLSIAGAWAGLNGKESSAFWGFVRILEELGERRPPLVMLENVFGFLQSNQGKDFEKALLALDDLGYAVDAFVLNARHWVPQSRLRLFVVGKYGTVSKSGSSTSTESEMRPKALTEFINTHANVSWDIVDLPSLPRTGRKLHDIVEPLSEDDPHWWSKKRAQYFFDQLSDRHRQIAKEMIARKRYSFATAFRRVRHGKSMAELRADGIAGCLRTPRGGSGRQILFKAGNGTYRVRLLTARECARLQGVPDDYVINVPLNQALFGFGDAVCVHAVAWIARHYLAPALASVRQTRNVRVRMA